jgi:hypothetical protein
MSSITASEILDNTTAACTAVHPDAFPRTIDEVRESASNAEALRAYARQARSARHDHIDHIGGHIDRTDVTDDDHMKTARATTPKYLSRLIFPRVRASG